MTPLQPLHPQLHHLAFQVHVLLRLRRQELLGVCGQCQGREGIIAAMDPRYSGLEALEHRGQRVGLLADEDAPLGVDVGLGHMVPEAQCAGVYGGHRCALRLWYVS
jgi:hypothetical protein